MAQGSPTPLANSPRGPADAVALLTPWAALTPLGSFMAVRRRARLFVCRVARTPRAPALVDSSSPLPPRQSKDLPAIDLPATDLPITDPLATDPLATDPPATDQPAPDPNSSRSAVGTQPIDEASDLQLAAPGSRIETEPQGFAAASLAELRKVVWPSRQQLFSESVAVILMVGLSAAAIAAVDRFYGWASTQVFR